MIRILTIITISLGSTLPNLPLSAAITNLDRGNLRKVGESQVRILGLFKIFDAAFYMEENYQAEDFPGNFSYALELTYQRSIKRDALIKSADKILTELHSRETLDQISAQLGQINEFYVDVENGDTYALTYHPDQGTTLFFNGKPAITLAGSDFARIYFSIWLGDHPTTEKLKRELLGS